MAPHFSVNGLDILNEVFRGKMFYKKILARFQASTEKQMRSSLF